MKVTKYNSVIIDKDVPSNLQARARGYVIICIVFKKKIRLYICVNSSPHWFSPNGEIPDAEFAFYYKYEIKAPHIL